MPFLNGVIDKYSSLKRKSKQVDFKTNNDINS